MNAALWISKTGLSAQDAEMSAIANNIANVNTTGFKRDRVMFQDLFYQTPGSAGRDARPEQHHADRAAIR
ncbi:flagellar basal body rod protein FlgG [Escherichia coli]|nr:flagellar basal body rod protein FlgG [Escherichia coli]